LITSLGPIRFEFRPPPQRSPRPAIFLDRDGVINERIWGGFVTRSSEFRLLDDIVPALRALSRLRLPLIVVSNQSGVNRGILGRESLRHITVRFVNLLARHGVRIDAVYYCPHTNEDQCGCRKPKPGLLIAAARDYRIDLSRSVMIGDEQRDIDAALAAGCRGVLLDPSHGEALLGGEGIQRAEGRAGRNAQVDALPDQVAALLGRLE
jgi:D-glycero-D-manno-heptose 1,7-bisphosphate phosphatase